MAKKIPTAKKPKKDTAFTRKCRKLFLKERKEAKKEGRKWCRIWADDMSETVVKELKMAGYKVKYREPFWLDEIMRPYYEIRW